jgi:fimbrial chaperone protein
VFGQAGGGLAKHNFHFARAIASRGNIMARIPFFILAILAILAQAAAPVHAYDLKPLVIQLAPTGSGATQTVVITNTHNVPIAIEVELFQRVQNPDGTDRLTVEENDLLVTPPQMIIPPGQSQSIKVRWIGDAAPATELSYRLVTTQLPIRLTTEETGGVNAKIDVGYRYEAALYIVPPKSKPNATLVSLSPVQDQNGKTWMHARVKSDGTRRAILMRPELIVQPANGGAEMKLSGPQVEPLNNLNILVGAERVVVLPWPEGLPVGELSGQLRSNYMTFD